MSPSFIITPHYITSYNIGAKGNDYKYCYLAAIILFNIIDQFAKVNVS